MVRYRLTSSPSPTGGATLSLIIPSLNESLPSPVFIVLTGDLPVKTGPGWE